MFNTASHRATPRHTELYGFYEKLYTTIDLLAGLAFLVGSVLFFGAATQYAATWLFVIGSALFVARPASRFAREFHLAQLPLPGDDAPRADTPRDIPGRDTPGHHTPGRD